MTTPPLPTTLRATTAAALRLALVLAEAEAVQWSPSMTPKPRDDTSERSRGGHSDPTLNTVVDERRLALRAEVEHAETALAEYVTFLDATRAGLERRVTEWAGQ